MMLSTEEPLHKAASFRVEAGEQGTWSLVGRVPGPSQCLDPSDSRRVQCLDPLCSALPSPELPTLPN